MAIPLSQREFDTWRESDTAFKEQMLAHITQQTATNFDVERRVSTLQAYQDRSNTRTGVISTLVSSVVAAIVGAIAGGAR